MTDLTPVSGVAIADQQNPIIAGPHCPVLLHDFYMVEKLRQPVNLFRRLSDNGRH
jgi:catalase